MRLLEHSIQKTVIYNRLLTEPDTRCRARMKEGECHVKYETKRILAPVSGVQRKNENKGGLIQHHESTVSDSCDSV